MALVEVNALTGGIKPAIDVGFDTVNTAVSAPQASVIKSIQRGNFIISRSQAYWETSISVSAVDLAKSFLTYSSGDAAGINTDYCFMSTSTSIIVKSATQSTSTRTVALSWELVEYV